MKVSLLKEGQLEKEMRKYIRVQAIGDTDIFVGYYNHLRRRGGDIFTLKPVIRDRLNKETKKVEKILITAEMQFSERWMRKVPVNEEETAPVHFNQAGRGRKRYNIPGMTRKMTGENDNAMFSDTQPDYTEESRNSQQVDTDSVI